MSVVENKVPFPAIGKISFWKLFDSLEAQTKDPEPHVARHAKALLKELEPYPELREGLDDLSLVEKYAPQIAKLLRPIFPDALQLNEIKGVTGPFSFDVFHRSKRLENIEKNAGKDGKMEISGFDPDAFYRMGCASILAMHFGFYVDTGIPMMVEIPDVARNMVRTYRIAFNADMMEVLPTKKSVNITEEDFRNLMENYQDMELWKSKFPPNSWIMRGIGIVNLTDVTADTSLAAITANLLAKDTATPAHMRDKLRALFNISDLEVGFVAYEEGTFWRTHHNDEPSMLMGNLEQMVASESLCEGSAQCLLVDHQPLIVVDVPLFQKRSKSLAAGNIKKSNINSYLCVPLRHNGDYLGFLELGSPRAYELNGSSLAKLEALLPILNMAVGRFKEESKNRIEAIIQQECTTIHSSVKWRFEDQARAYMKEQYNGGQPQFADIVFPGVYPLYGQTDIKGSSAQRNEAVKADLLTQTTAVYDLLQAALNRTHLPALEELSHRVQRYMHEVEDGLLAGSEHQILGFLKSEIYPVLNHLESTDDELANMVAAYSALLDPDLHVVYKERKKFDQSVTRTNAALAAFIDRKQAEAQAMFPHYFERYKTDGLEYNMYIGQSLLRNRKYHDLYLSNLRLWQLLMMCEMENEFHVLQQQLESPLEVASLILVYNTPLAIHFRMDEKRFDVEGAYNARYEIVKKRVDKAHIKDTNERVTQPGQLAIIYTNTEDRIEYQRYLDFLVAKGYLVPNSIEDHPLEDLQGITGLRALRVKVAYPESGLPVSHSYNELIAALSEESKN